MNMSIAVDPSLLRRIDRAAEVLGMSRSAFVCGMIEDGLVGAEQQLKFLADRRVMTAFAEAFSAPGVMSAMAKAIGEEIDEAKTQALLGFFESAAKSSEPSKSSKGGKKK